MINKLIPHLSDKGGIFGFSFSLVIAKLRPGGGAEAI